MDTPKKKILIVDDSPDLSKALSDMLTFKGYEVTVVHNGRDGSQTALALHPDLILLDLRMPDMNGFEVIKSLQRDAWGATANILMLSAINEAGRLPPGIKLSPNDYLLKSRWSMDEIAKKVGAKLHS